jgi:hypothetical protein
MRLKRKLYTFKRMDTYTVEVEAVSLKEAKQKLDDDDQYLNGGEYAGSDFEVIDEADIVDESTQAGV